MDAAKGDGSGFVYFYDLDDGHYLAVSSTYEQAWTVDVVGGVPTVVALAGGGPTGGPEPNYAYIA